jgi:dihydroorotase-like cyclic amidohydrolase
MLDTVISGGMTVLPTGAEPADLGVQGEKIVAIGAPGSLAALGAGRTIDASGQIVIPGGIDPHVHCNWPMPVPDGEAAGDRASHAAMAGPVLWRLRLPHDALGKIVA